MLRTAQSSADPFPIPVHQPARRAGNLGADGHDGYLIGDAIQFGLDDDEFSLVGAPFVPDWVAYRTETGGYDVDVRRDERTLANPGGRRVYRYQLQGPNALEIVEQGSGGSMPPVRFFNIGAFTIDGYRSALNHTMIGIPDQDTTGLEM